MLEEKVLGTINKYNMIKQNDKKVLVAVSGGFDSTCLLYLLDSLKSELNIELVVAHVNHCLRENAIIDEKFVKDLCEKLNIPVFIAQIDVSKIAMDDKLSLEMAGRKARYEFFDKICEQENCTKIATAHNANDNAETVLLNIFRGTGLKGLKGIHKVREDKYIRPLIESTRNEINEYLEKNSIQIRLDESNLENEYRRNKVRNDLIPYIKENFNTNIINTINKMSDIIALEDEFINKIADSSFKQVVIKNDVQGLVINAKKFSQMDIVLQKRIILKCIGFVNGTTVHIEEVNIMDILRMINNNIGNKYIIPIKGLKVYINKSQIYFNKI